MEDLQGGALALEHRYEIGRSTGTIGFSSVYQGVQHPFSKQVSIIVFDALAESGADDALVARIRESAERYAELDHDGVVRAVDVGELDVNLPFVVVESTGRERLASHLDRVGSMSLDETVTLIRRLARVVSNAHRQGVIHGSLAPVWIHVDGDDLSTAQIEFWGLGLSVAEMRSMDDAYMSFDAVCALPPEMFEEEAEPSESTDVYGLAAIAFRALSGIHPFFDDVSDTSEGLLRMQREDAASLTEYGVEEEVADVIGRGLARDPDKRWTSIEDFADALERAAAPEDPEDDVEEREAPDVRDDDHSAHTDDSWDDEPELWGPSEYDANLPSPRGGLLAFAIALLLITNAGWYLFNPLGDTNVAAGEVETEVLPEGVHVFTKPEGAKVLEVRDGEESELGETPIVIDPRIRTGDKMVIRLKKRGYADQTVEIRGGSEGNEIEIELAESE